MYIVDSHCDSVQQVAARNHPIVNPYNLSQKYNQLQMYAMFCGWPGEDARASYKRATRYMGLFSVAMDNESDKIVKVSLSLRLRFRNQDCKLHRRCFWRYEC